LKDDPWLRHTHATITLAHSGKELAEANEESGLSLDPPVK
jgi:hypothetical protein